MSHEEKPLGDRVSRIAVEMIGSLTKLNSTKVEVRSEISIDKFRVVDLK